MSETPLASSTETPVSAQPLGYARAIEADRPIEPRTSRQVWMGMGFFFGYLAWSFVWLFADRVVIGVDSWYFRDLEYRVLRVLPLLAATIWVMRMREWRPSAAALLLAAGWVAMCSDSLARLRTPVGWLWWMIPPVGSAVYLLAIRRYRGVAIGLFAALGLTMLLAVGIVIAVVSRIRF